eukprot:TRINITY_DN18118_c0_g1_i1.p1 TRINITY_DN18118_c0_g1~~TRINITY_DN18118_c0_g1_i1.p1  ORF type:complete len:460 (-),score=70.29 TRINITY_DN18118_c0_g1_i1:318-1697(-)
MKRRADEALNGGLVGLNQSLKWPVKGRLCLKALCPDILVKAILGPRGSTKDEIQAETGARLVFSNKDDYYPGTQLRVLGIYADDFARIVNAFEWVIPKIIDLGDQERMGQQPPQHGSASDFLGKEAGEYLIRLCVSKCSSGEIIGPGGSRIKELRLQTGTKIFIDNETHFGHQVARIIGPPEGLQRCVERVAEASRLDFGAEEYASWAQLVNFTERVRGEGTGDAGRSSRRPRREGAGGADAWPRKGNQQDTDVQPPKHGTRGQWPLGSGDEEGSFEQKNPFGTGVDNNTEIAEVGGWSGEAQPPPPGGAEATERVGLLAEAIGRLPPGAAGVAYSMRFELPSCRIDGLAQEEYVAHVQQTTSVHINVDDEAEDAEDPWSNRSVNLIGPLVSIYTAHLLLLKRVKEAEQQEVELEQQELADDPVEEDRNPAALKAKIQELEAQLAQARQGSAAGRQMWS